MVGVIAPAVPPNFGVKVIVTFPVLFLGRDHVGFVGYPKLIVPTSADKSDSPVIVLSILLPVFFT